MDINKIIARVKAILLTPKTEWPVIAGEPETVGNLYRNYIIVLAAIPAVMGFIKYSLIGASMPFVGTFRIGIAAGLSQMIVTFVLSLIGVYVVALIVDALAPSFDGQKDPIQALKVVAYSYTASWIAGIALILPLSLASLVAIAGAIYSIYLLYLGLPQLMKCPQEKSAGYTAVSIIAAIVLAFVIGMISRGLGGGAAGPGMTYSSNDSDVTFDKDSPLGQLDQWGKSVEQASKHLEAAQKSGNQDAQAAAMKSMLGAALGGGTVEALAPERLKAFIPESLDGMPRTEFSSERNNAMGMQISEARGTFANEAGRSVKVEITDTGSAKGFLGLAKWAGVEGEKQTDSGYEKTYRDDGRLIHEEWHGTRGEYTVVIADRFTVQAEGYADSIDQLKAAVSDLDLSGLEDLKTEGVKAE